MIAQLVCQPVCLGGNFEIEVILHQGVKLHAQQPTLGQHTAVLFDEVAEILVDGRIHDHHRFPKQGTHLGAADVEDIAKSGQIRQGHIVSFCL